MQTGSIDGVTVKPLIRHGDQRGYFLEIVRASQGLFSAGFGQLSWASRAAGRIWTTTDMFETPDYYAKCLELAGPVRGERILDVACGGGYLLKEAGRRGLTLSGLDIAQAALDRTKKIVPQADLRQGEAEHMPFADGSFDVVTCLGSLEHFLEPSRALEEMRRVLAPGGRAIVAIPNQWWAYDMARGWLEGAGLRHGQESENFFSLAEARELVEGSFHIGREWPWNPPVSHMRATRPFTGRWRSLAFRTYGWVRPRLPFVASYLFVFKLVKAPGDALREVASDTGPVIPGGWQGSSSQAELRSQRRRDRYLLHIPTHPRERAHGIDST